MRFLSYSVLLPERLTVNIYSFAPSAPDLTGVFRVLSVISPTAMQYLRDLLLRSILMNHLLGVNGIAWATPIADTGAMLCAILRFIPFWKRLKAEQQGN